MPEEVARADRPGAREQGPQGRTIERSIVAALHARDVEQRRRNVERGHGHVARRARPHDPRPAHDHRHADAALVDEPLPGAKREIRRRCALGGRETAVVAREHDERVLLLARLHHRSEHRRHRLVHLADHAGIHGMILHLPRGRIARHRRRDLKSRAHANRSPTLLGGEFRPRDQGHVHGMHRHVAEEWSVAVRLDEGRGLRRDRPGMHRIIARSAAGAHGRGAGHLESMGRDVGGRPEVPLAEHARRIARVAQPFGDGDFARRERMEIVGREQAATSVTGDEVRDPHPRRMPTGDERRSRRRTDRGRRIPAGKEQAFGRKPVDRR